ncbi:MAG: hypothetical protein ACXW4A_07410 [Nitrospira sp.]
MVGIGTNTQSINTQVTTDTILPNVICLILSLSSLMRNLFSFYSGTTSRQSTYPKSCPGYFFLRHDSLRDSDRAAVPLQKLESDLALCIFVFLKISDAPDDLLNEYGSFPLYPQAAVD